MERLGKGYPRPPICLKGDALYAADPVMEICRNHRWKYVLTQKATRQKALAESYEWIARGGGAETVTGIGKEKGTGEYVNHAEETAGKKEIHEFQWLISIELTKKNLEEMIEAGCGRWRIENEGFNNQKNGIYDIEHLNSRDSNAMKNLNIPGDFTPRFRKVETGIPISWEP